MHRPLSASTRRRRTAARTAVAGLALLATACRPVVPAVPAATSPADAAATPGVDATPDADGYDADPAGTPDPWGYAPGDDWIAHIDGAADGDLLADLQALLDARNVDGLAGLVGAADDPSARLKLRAADGREPLAMLTADDAKAALTNLLGGLPPFQPAVQSAARGNSATPDSEASSADVWVALSGWPVGHGHPMIVVGEEDARTTPPAPPAVTSTATMVWRFTPAGDGWRWIEWRLGEASYRATIEDLAQDLQDDAPYPAHIHAVRRAEWWPPNDAPCDDVSTSPDGAWTVCAGEGEGRPLSLGYFRPLRLEVRSADGAMTHVGVFRWESHGDIGTLSVKVIGWSVDPMGLLFAMSGCGDGCGPWLCGVEDLRILTVPDGRIEPVAVEGMDYALAPDGRRLATLGPGDSRRIVLRILDLASGDVVSTGLDGEGGSFAWSPDGASIAIVAQFNTCGFDDSKRAALHRLDTATGNLTTLVPALLRTSAWLRADAWADPAVIEVHVNRPDGDRRWVGIERRDARTGALLGAATATPPP